MPKSGNAPVRGPPGSNWCSPFRALLLLFFIRISKNVPNRPETCGALASRSAFGSAFAIRKSFYKTSKYTLEGGAPVTEIFREHSPLGQPLN